MNSFLKMIAAVQSVVHMPRVIAGWSFGLWKRSTASRLTFICVGLSLVACRAQAQFHLYETCTPPPASNCGAVPIPDYPGGPAELSLTVPFDPAGTFITDIEVRLWIQHTYQGDLVIEIISPAGTAVTLVNRPGLGGGFSADDFGGFAHDNQNIYFGPFALNDFSFINNFIYDYPGVPFPGIDFSQSPFGFPAVGLRTFLPVTPLAALRGENKTGTWTLRVTDMAAIDTGNIRYLGLGITTHPLTQPVATISMPSAFASACNPTTIIGTANDPDGALTSYTVEFASNPQGPWATIGGGTAAVVNGALAVWNTVATGATEGFKFVRLTATNEIGLSSSFVTILYVDQGFNGINVRTPTAGAILGGTVCPDGSITDYSFVNYRVDFAAGPSFSTFNPVDPAHVTYTSQVENDPIATWNTRSGGAAAADGTYRLRFMGTDSCGHTATLTRDVVIDNTPPVAIISSPVTCTNVTGTVAISGTVTDTHLAGWSVQYIGGDAHNWVTIGSGTTPVSNGVLVNWNTAGLRSCAYALRLVASDSAGVNCQTGSNASEFGVVVNLGCAADFNHSGNLNSQDFFDFVSAFFAGCP